VLGGFGFAGPLAPDKVAGGILLVERMIAPIVVRVAKQGVRILPIEPIIEVVDAIEPLDVNGSSRPRGRAVAIRTPICR
jgi:hypothetical protein